jgi:hypothetical protein
LSIFTPAAWDGIGIVSFLIIAFIALAWAFLTGKLVLGVHHREIVAEKDRALEAADRRATEDSVSIGKFADAAAKSTAAAEVQQAMVTAIRQLAEERT